MATIRQKRAHELIKSGSVKSYGEAIVKAGYAPSTAVNPSTNLIDRPGYKELEKADKQRIDLDITAVRLKNIVAYALQRAEEKLEKLKDSDNTGDYELKAMKVIGDYIKDHPNLASDELMTLSQSIELLKQRKSEQTDSKDVDGMGHNVAAITANDSKPQSNQSDTE